ncbi:MAG: response regulator [Patescibacteria group bacterium]|jgi:DNA-binding response OmpR family regulator
MPKILLVEDDEMLHSMYTQKFSQDGYKVISAYNGSDGLKKAKEEKPDLVLLDIIMPKMDGFVTLKRIKADKDLQNTPVIMLTNLGQDEDIKKGKELGADDYFIKANHTPAEVVSKVKSLLKKKK